MIAVSQTYHVERGGTYIQSPELSNVFILMVKVEGRQFDSSNGAAPTGRKYQYVDSEGKINLPETSIYGEYPSPGPATPQEENVRVFVIYKVP